MTAARGWRGLCRWRSDWGHCERGRLKGLKSNADKFVTRSVIEADYKVLQLLWRSLSFRVIFGAISFHFRQPRRVTNPHKLVVSGVDHLDAASGHVRAFVGLHAIEEDSRFSVAIVGLDIERQFTFSLQ